MRFSLLAAMCVAACAPACGGDGGDGVADAVNDQGDAADVATDVVDGPELAVIAGTVELPAGVTAARVINGFDDVVVTDGAFTLRSPAGDRQLAVALADSGEPLVVAWLGSEDTTLNSRTTAEVMTYLALGAFRASPELKAAIIGELEQAPELAAVAAALDATLSANPDGIGELDEAVPALETALEAAVRSLLGALAAPLPNGSILVNPSAEGSGISLDITSGINEVVLTNRFRRRAFAFVDRVATIKGGVATASEAVTARIPIEPVEGLRDGVGTLKQIIIGANDPSEMADSDALAYTPKSSEPLALENIGDADRTRYRVAIVGPGDHPGAIAELTAEEQARAHEVAVEFAVRDYIVPFITDIVAPAKVVLDPGADNAITAEVIEILKDQPPFLEHVATGKVAKGLAVVLGVGAFKAKLPTAVLTRVVTAVTIGTYGPTAGAAALQSHVISSVRSVIQGFAAVNVTLKMADAGFIEHDMGASNQADVWTVDVGDALVRLDPETSTIFEGEIVTLTANVVDAAEDVVFEYRFETAGQFGTLQGANARGNVITSSAPFITYDAASPGTETVKVIVFQVDGAARKPIGDAEATITVDESGVAITPARAEVDPLATLELKAALEEADPPIARRVVWSIVDDGGTGATLDGKASVEATLDAGVGEHTVTFAAGLAAGDHLVSVTVYRAGPGGEKLTEGRATVTVKPFDVSIAPPSASLSAGETLPLRASVTPAPAGVTYEYAWQVASAQGLVDGQASLTHTGTAAEDTVTYKADDQPTGCEQKVALDVTVKKGALVAQAPRTHAFLNVGCAAVSIALDTPNTEANKPLGITVEVFPAPEGGELRFIYSLTPTGGAPLGTLSGANGVIALGQPVPDAHVTWLLGVKGFNRLAVEAHHIVGAEDTVLGTAEATLYAKDATVMGWIERQVGDFDGTCGLPEETAAGWIVNTEFFFVTCPDLGTPGVRMEVDLPEWTQPAYCSASDPGTCYPEVVNEAQTYERELDGSTYLEDSAYFSMHFDPPNPEGHWMIQLGMNRCYPPAYWAAFEAYRESVTTIRCYRANGL